MGKMHHPKLCESFYKLLDTVEIQAELAFFSFLMNVSLIPNLLSSQYSICYHIQSSELHGLVKESGKKVTENSPVTTAEYFSVSHNTLPSTLEYNAGVFDKEPSSMKVQV